VSALYPLFDIGSPVPVPRMTATFIPPPMIAALEQSHLAWEEFIDAPARLANELAAALLGPRVNEARTRASERIDACLKEYLKEVSRALPDRAAVKYESQVEDGRRRLERSLDRLAEASRQGVSDAWPWIGAVEEIIAPHGRAQERILSLLTPFLVCGEGASDEMLRLAGRFVNDLLDGKPAHYVYSFS
jgi:non-ribosomal peptide synthetase component F